MKMNLRRILTSFLVPLSSFLYAEAPRVVPEILDSIPHERSHFTQGLFFDGNDLIETTGLYGKSGLYRRTLDGKIIDSTKLSERYFGEGSIAVGDDIFYLTWKSKKAFIYNRKPFSKKGEFYIPTEGWGLTYWKNALLMSNGRLLSLPSFRSRAERLSVIWILAEKLWNFSANIQISMC